MLSWVCAYHRWVEAFHVISVISWMVGMLYLPRLYVYHSKVSYGSESDAMLSLMERRLLLYIMNPAMLATLVTGILLAVAEGYYVFLWFKVKFMLVLAMLTIHALLAQHGKNLSRNECKRSSLYFRILNEAVTALMVAIVIMVMVQPFM
ncbi:MAG: protoporphyrinogen oxidase HemJ [Anaplasma ovis]|uniref:Protoporphyrinogen IX oxidase n=1 Tax=Anaplasma ovis str. Haibei TaxID=1248439 RepID=A0A2Z2LC85_9RICK|nr:protoporphyrinogen oxidase HemJ [Anaplasma ovis]ASI48011.1 TIGR00701 family protein [Anaplasma ovis str. Haibei]